MRLLEVAHKKDAEVWRELGTAYFCGHGTIQNIEQAEAWYRLAANAGDAKAMLGVAHCLRAGNDSENLVEAVEWYRKACTLGNVAALKHLARAYGNGKGVQADINRATELMLRWYDSSDWSDDVA